VLTRAEGEALYRAYCDELAKEHGRLVVIKKGESGLCRVIDRALKVLTFGRQSRFLTSYTTTLGKRIYVPDDWERYPAIERYLILRHEAVHVRQFRRFTWPGMTLIYLLLPLPMGLAAGRALIEWEAYRETLVATWQVKGEVAARDPALADHIVARFVGADYGWMWVFGGQVRRAIARTLRELEQTPPPPVDHGVPTSPNSPIGSRGERTV
jgi:hypothetical protein